MIALVATVLGTAIVVVVLCWVMRLLRDVYSLPAPQWPLDHAWPKAAIILSLRGGDPFLKQCLRNLILQDYPSFQIHIVIDSESDPAWQAINEIRAEFANAPLEVAVLSQRQMTCSLKNSSLIQGIRRLPDDCEFVAFVDADAITHTTWLKSLITPFADPHVGATTGIRWFAPPDRRFGTRLRCFWNLIAASVIHQSQVPWGGSMVLRRQLLDSGLTDEWSRMFCEDVHTANFLQERGLKLAYVSEATVVNQETTSAMSCVRFVNRQAFILRLYTKNWWPVIGATLVAAAIRISNIYLTIDALITGQWGFAAAYFVTYVSVQLAMWYESSQLDAAVRRTARSNGQEISAQPIPVGVTFFCAEVMSLTSMLLACMVKKVQWRGVSYHVAGPVNVRMVEYRPFAQAIATRSHGSSVT